MGWALRKEAVVDVSRRAGKKRLNRHETGLRLRAEDRAKFRERVTPITGPAGLQSPCPFTWPTQYQSILENALEETARPKTQCLSDTGQKVDLRKCQPR